MARLLLAGLMPGSDYFVQFRARDDDSVSDWSRRFALTTDGDSIPPDTPTGLTFTSVGDTFVASWTGINMALSQNLDFDHYELALVAGATTIIIRTADLTYSLSFNANRNYFTTPQAAIGAKVRSVDSSGNASSYTSVVNASNPAPGAPTGGAVVSGIDSLDISWTAPSDVDLTGYNVYVGTTAGFTPSGGNRVWTGNALRFTYTSTTYILQYFKIRAVDVFGQESTDLTVSGTPTSVPSADTTAPATPTGLAATITTTTTASLATSAAVSWTANTEPDLAGYFVRYRVNGTTPWNTVRYDKLTTSSVISNLVPYVNYDFQIAAVDFSENQSSYSSTATGTGATNSAPSTPTAPTVSTSTMQAQVTVPGTKAAGGAMEADVSYYEVYGSTTTGFTPGTTNMLGVVSVGPAMIETFQIPTGGNGSTQTWYFKIIAVDNGGLKSTASAQTTATPSLIQATNITDATITNAKINDLAANKITAGTGIINNLSVKSTLTIGDASTSGSIQSFDYSAGTAGFKLASVGGVASLEINQGTIRAPALMIQSGASNLIQSQYADFEFNPTFYTTGLTFTGGGSATIDLTDKLFNLQSLKWVTAAASTVHLATSATTDFGSVLNPSTTYIISYYAMIKTGATASTITPSIRWNTSGSFADGAGSGASVAANSTWARYTTTVAVPGTSLGKAHLFFTSSAATTVYIDGIQIEEKMSAATTASTWNPPGGTTISGSSIRTGSITSSATAQVLAATPVYDSTGNILYYGNATLVTDPDARPAWTINASGSAEFSNLTVRGNVLVGDPNTVSATTPFVTTIDTTSGSATIVTVSGDITINDIGLSITSANLPGGTTIASITDSTHAVVSANATASATSTSATVARPLKYLTQIASANYVQGTQGWVIRSDGLAEFQQVIAGTFDGSAIKAGTLTADAIGAGTITSDISLAGSFQTPITYSGIDLNTTSGSATVTTTAGQFFPDDIGALVVNANLPANTVVLSVTDAVTVVVSANATATASGVDSQIFRQRSVAIDSAGIRLTTGGGQVVVNLPTDPAASSQFTGSITADSLLVQDLFQMQGLRNFLGTGSQLTLSAGDYTPGTGPIVTFSYDKLHVLQGSPATNYSPNTDPNASEARAFMYDPVTNQYYWCVTQFGITFKRMWSSTGSNPYTLDFDIGVYNAFVSLGIDSPKAMAADASNFYFLTRLVQAGTTLWRFQKISRTGVFRAGGAIAGDRVASNTWTQAGLQAAPGGGGGPTTNNADGITNNPGIAVYGGNLYTAKLNKTGKLVLTKYTGVSGTNTVDFEQTKGVVVTGGSVRSLTVGKFDVDGTNVYMIITIAGNTGGKVNYMYKVDIGGSQFVGSAKDFPMVDDKDPVGTAWFAATTDTSTGHFESVCQDGTIGLYNGLACNTTGSSVQAAFAWRNSNATTPPGGLSPQSPFATYPLRRRAKMTISAPVPIPNTGGTSPNSVSFKLGIDSGTHWRYPDPATGVPFLTVSTIQTSDSTSVTPSAAILSPAPVNYPLVVGNPSVITNGLSTGNTLYLDGNGDATIKSLTVGGGNGTKINNITMGSYTYTTNGSGIFTLTHNLGVTPVFIGLTDHSGLRLTYRITGDSTTTSTVEVWNVETGSVSASSSRTVSWVAIG